MFSSAIKSGSYGIFRRFSVMHFLSHSAIFSFVSWVNFISSVCFIPAFFMSSQMYSPTPVASTRILFIFCQLLQRFFM